MFTRLKRPRILVSGRQGGLSEAVVDGVRRDGERVKWIDAEALPSHSWKAVHTLILVDPPEPFELVASLRTASRPAEREGERVERRLILLHPDEAPPTLPELGAHSGWRVETFSLYAQLARILLRRWPLHFGFDPCFGQRLHLMIAGFNALARAILSQALRLGHYGPEKPRLTLLADKAHTLDEIEAHLLHAYPQAREIADIRCLPKDGFEQALYGERSAFAPARATHAGHPGRATPITFCVVCPPDSGPEGLNTARHIARQAAAIQGTSPPILLAAHETLASGPIEHWDGQIFPFVGLRSVCRADVLIGRQDDEVAQSIHEQYRDSIAVQGRDPEQEPAGQPWERLESSYRDANRHQADHVWAKLALIDCRSVREELVESFSMAPLEVERLALVEHQRWAADRYLSGWRFGAVRDNRLKHHPQLIPYETLSEPMKDLDRFAVRNLPALLARQGLGILRLLIVGISGPVELPAGGRRRGRWVDPILDRLVTRYPDRALILASTLTDPGSRFLVRRALARYPDTGLFLLSPHPLPHTLAELEDSSARRDFLTLVARAQRRIGLRGQDELNQWLSERADISLHLGHRTSSGAAKKRVCLIDDTWRVEWTFEY